MRFPYIALPTRRPVYPLGGALVRHRPLVAVQIRGPSGARSLSATLDCGSDDTLLPAYLAPRPVGRARPVSRGIPCRCETGN
jgi:hypothetical protein